VRLTLQIDDLAPGGEGVGEAQGRAVFVPFTAPGDRVVVEVPPGEGAAHAELLELVAEGPVRQTGYTASANYRLTPTASANIVGSRLMTPSTLLRTGTDTLAARLLPDAPRNFGTTLVTNASQRSDEVVARSVVAGSTTETVTELGLSFPPGVFSLSHLAIPFPLSDPLYGLEPDTSEDYGANLGAIATRGERGTLIVSIDSLARMSSNPFFDYVMQRVEEGLSAAAKPKP